MSVWLLETSPDQLKSIRAAIFAAFFEKGLWNLVVAKLTMHCFKGHKQKIRPVPRRKGKTRWRERVRGGGGYPLAPGLVRWCVANYTTPKPLAISTFPRVEKEMRDRVGPQWIRKDSIDQYWLNIIISRFFFTYQTISGTLHFLHFFFQSKST